jgi:hypothetical protein
MGDGERSEKYRLIEYQHSGRYQAVLRTALNSANEKGFSDLKLSNILKDRGITFNRTSITRFRQDAIKFIKEEDAAEGLWNTLIGEGFIRIDDLLKSGLSSNEDLALHLNMFFETHDSQFQALRSHEFSGTFFGYKRSFRRPGSIIKSLFVVEPRDAGYFSVHEHQHLKAEREADGISSIEDSEGVAFSKSMRIWLLLKEVEFQQPRVFCFDRRKEHPDSGAVNILYGYCFESSRKFSDGVFFSRAMLVRAPSSDGDSWRDLALIEELRAECDLFPTSEFLAGPLYERSPRDIVEAALHPEIEEYIMRGQPRITPD